MSSTNKMVPLGKRLFDLKDRKAALENDLKKVDAEITHITTVELSKIMGDGEIEKFEVKGRGTIYLQDELFVNVLAKDRPALYEALRSSGNADIVKDWVMPGTLKAFCKEQLQGGKPLPAVVKATWVPTARTRKGK